MQERSKTLLSALCLGKYGLLCRKATRPERGTRKRLRTSLGPSKISQLGHLVQPRKGWGTRGHSRVAWLADEMVQRKNESAGTVRAGSDLTCRSDIWHIQAVRAGLVCLMAVVIVQPHKDFVLGPIDTRFDVICADCKAVLAGKLPSSRSAYCQADAIREAVSQHRCEVKQIQCPKCGDQLAYGDYDMLYCPNAKCPDISLAACGLHDVA